MTNAETLELIALYANNALTSFTIYISFTFGFLITAFIVGAKLTHYQVFVVCALYVISVGSMAISLIVNMQVWVAIKESHATIIDELPLANGTFWITYMCIVLMGGILVSLYFLWDIRQGHKLNSFK
ncbi:hypothetical protein RGQ13_18185 [Thalassotalea psychrophila]|uniref:Uncharacterized protein n=1 Tax=Thalassotalea psychrophila TaxID=3065647 RepID=A0ABY9TTC5_9GAMM|nr:hypothetical protein RGQ13_18185 [Colwelliaceae bacterium SQ149]